MKSSLMPQSADNSSTEKCRSNVISEMVVLTVSLSRAKGVTTLAARASARLENGDQRARSGRDGQSCAL